MAGPFFLAEGQVIPPRLTFVSPWNFLARQAFNEFGEQVFQ